MSSSVIRTLFMCYINLYIRHPFYFFTSPSFCLFICFLNYRLFTCLALSVFVINFDHTIHPRSPFFYSKLLYKNGQDFWTYGMYSLSMLLQISYDAIFSDICINCIRWELRNRCRRRCVPCSDLYN